jgi:UDP-glucose 4-epimerase
MTKKILITGKNSYIGRSFMEYCEKNNVDFEIDELDTHGDEWKKTDFSTYDVVYHVAGIAHNSSDPELEDLYYQVNRDLTIEIAKKAKEDGVAQFIFMSSMIIYGNNPNGKTKITENTEPNPDNFYGDSKLQAEISLKELESEDFNVVILRPPMIYGKGSKGNYPLLSKFAQKSPIFPNYPNKRSMLHIDNLCEFLRLMIINEEKGIFHPQNKELVQTSEMVRLIAEHHNNRIWFTRLGNPFINLTFKVNMIKKVFGDLYYDKSLSDYQNNVYQINSLKESIKNTEV